MLASALSCCRPPLLSSSSRRRCLRCAASSSPRSSLLLPDCDLTLTSQQASSTVIARAVCAMTDPTAISATAAGSCIRCSRRAGHELDRSRPARCPQTPNKPVDSCFPARWLIATTLADAVRSSAPRLCQRWLQAPRRSLISSQARSMHMDSPRSVVIASAGAASSCSRGAPSVRASTAGTLVLQGTAALPADNESSGVPSHERIVWATLGRALAAFLLAPSPLSAAATRRPTSCTCRTPSSPSPSSLRSGAGSTSQGAASPCVRH